VEKIVGYDYREHMTVVSFEPGEEKFFRLPPISPGQVVVASPDQDPVDPKHRPPRSSSGGDLTQPPPVPPAPRDDLVLELTHPGGISATGTVGVTADSLWTDDLWRVRVTDKRPAGTTASRDVRLVAKYNSLLPMRERRVPTAFYRAGFETNYNDQQYLHVAFDGINIEIGFREDFALLYGLELPGDPKHLFRVIPVYPASFDHRVEMSDVVFDVGAGPHPNGSGNSVFFSIRCGFPAVTVNVETPVVPDFSFPLEPFSVLVRLWLSAFNGRLYYVPTIESNLLDQLDHDVTVPDTGSTTFTKTINLKQYVTDAIQDALYRAQYPYENDLDYPSSFGALLGRWLAGRESPIRAVSYAPGPGDKLGTDGIVEQATGDIVVHYVDVREPPQQSDLPTAIGPGGAIGGGETSDDSIPLFDPPFRDEEPQWDPSELGGLPGRQPGSHPHTRDLGPLGQIDHIVVLMQENRSFDHVMGYLSKLKLDPRVDGLLPDDDPNVAKQFNHYTDPQGGQANFYPKPAAGTGWDPHIPGPCHEHECVVAQVGGGAMGGFVSQWAERLGPPGQPVPANDPRLELVMEYHTPEQLPMYELLRKEFVLCDAWHTSHPGPTWPNRFVLLTGDLNTDAAGNVEENSPVPTVMPPIQRKTIFDYLTAWDVPWRVFEHGYSFPRLFRNFTYNLTDITAFHDPNDGFEATARSGRLPAVTLIEPDYIELPPGNDDHAPANMACGQDLVNHIFRALVASPDWDRTLFLITYDEHGGFYDHKEPPTNAVPPLANNSDVLGPRVPGFVISPLVERGQVTHEVFDHTSIGATILRRFAPVHGPVPSVSPRMDAARDFGFLLTQPARPQSDFDSLELPQLLEEQYKDQPELNPCQPVPALRAAELATDAPDEDFHWLLATVRLATGQPPRTVTPRPPRGRPDDRPPGDHPTRLGPR